MSKKQRLSVSVDAELIEAVEDAVAQRRSDSVSAWVNEAVRAKLIQERRLEALSTFITAYEASHGAITDEEMRLATRRARASAVAVRGSRPEKRDRIHRRRSPR